MALERDRAHESDGLILDDGTYFSYGPNVPVHSAVEGDMFFRYGVSELYRYESGAWVLKEFGGDFVPNFVLTRDLCHVWTRDLCPVIIRGA